jgi:sulfite reductase alpha subunit-like flavoprotein
MVASGTDGASREGAQNILGPYSTAVGRAKIAAFLELHGWKVTIDLFAADSNKLTERYASWTDEPDSEAVDAFSLPSWNQSSCPCGKVHRETAFMFRPKKLKEQCSSGPAQTASKQSSWYPQLTQQGTGKACAHEQWLSWS